MCCIWWPERGRLRRQHGLVLMLKGGIDVVPRALDHRLEVYPRVCLRQLGGTAEAGTRGPGDAPFERLGGSITPSDAPVCSVSVLPRAGLVGFAGADVSAQHPDAEVPPSSSRVKVSKDGRKLPCSASEVGSEGAKQGDTSAKRCRPSSHCQGDADESIDSALIFSVRGSEQTCLPIRRPAF